jgi:Flp pilus assembly protein TadB
LSSVLLGLLVAGVACLLAFGTVYARWTWRDRRRRRERRLEVERARDELERVERRLRLRVSS